MGASEPIVSGVFLKPTQYNKELYFYIPSYNFGQALLREIHCIAILMLLFYTRVQDTSHILSKTSCKFNYPPLYVLCCNHPTPFT